MCPKTAMHLPASDCVKVVSRTVSDRVSMRGRPRSVGSPHFPMNKSLPKQRPIVSNANAIIEVCFL